MFLHNLPKELVKPFLDIAYTVASSDGKIADEEKRTLELYAQELRLEKLPEGNIVDYSETLDKFASLDTVLKKEVFFELLAMAKADAKITDGENDLLDIAADKLAISGEMRAELEDVLTSLALAYHELTVILQKK